MNQSTSFDADDVTEEQAKAEIARIQFQIEQLFEQMKREREEGERITARTDAKMADVRAALARLQMPVAKGLI